MHGTSRPVAIERGTLQGDTLSPFLFLVFIEPLLRWLRVGGRGYKHVCTQEWVQQQPQCIPAAVERMRLLTACAAPACADDLAILTNTHRDLEVQAEKVTRFVDWSRLEVNHNKCAVTGMLHHDAATNLFPTTLHRDNVAALQRRLEGVHICGKNAPFYHPHHDAYKYLGVWINPSMNWSHHMKALASSVVEKGENLLQSGAYGTNRLLFIENCLKPHIKYSFVTGAFTLNDIARLDSLVARIAKGAMRFPGYTPNAKVHEDRCRGGLGVGSLLTDLVHITTSNLVKALNDKGPLGLVTKCLIETQQHSLGGLRGLDLAQGVQHCRHLRTVALLHSIGAKIQRHMGTAAATTVGLQANPLGDLAEKFRWDHKEPGIATRVPHRVFAPLWELGILSLSDVLEALPNTEWCPPPSSVPSFDGYNSMGDTIRSQPATSRLSTS